LKKYLIFVLAIFIIVFVVLFNVGNGLDRSLLTKKKEVSRFELSPTKIEIISVFSSPIANASSRVTKKSFGIYVSPQESPVQPEKFQGFHTGVDFETFSIETDTSVLVKAICEGKLIYKESASGYGGVLVQLCTLKNEPITVIYGHLKLTSVKFNVGDLVKSGKVLGELGQGYSIETDGERKHLHLAIHKGTEINILGYVTFKNQLSSWIDPCEYVCGK
jgi:murein DD-endopeptidase MepM/ murein hydrolase activator NlpD